MSKWKCIDYDYEPTVLYMYCIVCGNEIDVYMLSSHICMLYVCALYMYITMYIALYTVQGVKYRVYSLKTERLCDQCTFSYQIIVLFWPVFCLVCHATYCNCILKLPSFETHIYSTFLPKQNSLLLSSHETIFLNIKRK